MASMVKNTYRIPKTQLNYTRSLHRYERTHTTNLLTGYIVPVGYLNLMPGDTPPKNFGFVLQSAPLLGPTFDNIYLDIITVWCPTRLVMADHNEWLGDNDRYAWTLGNNISLPKITSLRTGKKANGVNLSKSYYAEHYRAPHYGCRYFNQQAGIVNFNQINGSNSRFYDGLQVIPFRQYDLIYNVLFRNQNVTNPVLFSKQSGSNIQLDVSNYEFGGGQLWRANRLKNIFTTARLAPAIQTVDVLQGISAPVGFVPVANQSLGVTSGFASIAAGSHVAGTFVPGLTNNSNFDPSNNGLPVIAELSGLTVNSLYYSIMLQKYLNKASSGRRPVEFYKEFFGIDSSEVGHDDPQLLSQKRFKVNISRVVATSNSQTAGGEDSPLGFQGAYSITTGGGSLFPSFTATEYGMIHIFAVIRTQESFASGIDRYLSDGDLLSTYLPVFDHIGEDSVDIREFGDVASINSNYVFGYQSAWYNYRYFVNDVVGIASPGAPLGYFTLAREFLFGSNNFTVNDDFIMQTPFEFDRMLQFPVCYANTSDDQVDIDGEPYNSDRYQWLIQFAVAGDFARTMSKESEQLLF